MTSSLRPVRTLGEITSGVECRAVGRTVTVDDLTGELVGVVPVAGHFQLALVVNGARMFTDRLPADTPVQIHPKGTP